tara:strand:- start:1261 stop:3459 length:2199 start_codon:yes stop_codon:yes gene_type:complete
MIKKLTKIISITFFLLTLIILYLSFVGIKTEKFNEKITNRISKINNKIELDLNSIKFLLDPLRLRVNIVTQDPTVLVGGSKLNIKKIKTNVHLKPLIFSEFSIDNLEISTKSIKLKDLIQSARFLKNSTELFLLERIIKKGSLTGDINLRFDKNGNIKNDYQITGFIKDAKINFLNKIKANNLNLEFDIKENKYNLTKINSDINEIELSSPSIEIKKKKDQFSVEGKILSDTKEFNRDQLDIIKDNFFKSPAIEKVIFNTENKISFNFNKKLKIKNLNIESEVNLDQIVFKNDFIKLKPYLPNLENLINFKNHKITIVYNKENLRIQGEGKILVKDKPDSINYVIVKNNNKINFNTKTNIKYNKLSLKFLDYEKKENNNASIEINGTFKNNSLINFDLISLTEKKNIILFKNISISKDLKLNSIDNFNFNYLNDNKIKNQLKLSKNNLDYIIEGSSFDASTLINKIMDNDDKNSSLLSNFNNKIILKIKKTHIDKVNFINDLSGTLVFKDNEIDNLNLKSNFSNNKTLNLSIKTNDKKEKTTKLSTNHPKPLIKRYDFIKGFEEGFLVYQSIKKDGVSDSLLTIENFKIREVPVFAKLLSLASLQGIADLLTGEGIRFDDFEVKFSNKKKLTTIEELYAIGPAVSILMEGYLETDKLISLRGTLVPATTINKTIASIPLLGNILVGTKTGDGIFGVSFKIKGAPKNLETTVNPIKTLTPRFITRTLENINKN